MATSGNTNVQLTVEATTLGGDAVRALADQVRALGKTGSEAAPEFSALAQQLDRVAAQADAITTFGNLESAVTATTLAVDQAKVAFDSARSALEQQQAATATFKTAQSDAAAALRSARDAAIGAKEGFAILNAEVKSHSEVTANDTERLREARIEVASTAAEVARLRLAQKDANSELSDAEKAQTKLAAALGVTTRQLNAAQAAAGTQRDALEAAGAAAKALEVDTTNLAVAQATLLERQQELTSGFVKQQAAVAASQAAKKQAEENALYLEYEDAVREVTTQLAAQAASEKAVAEAIEAKRVQAEVEAYSAYERAVAEINAVLADEAAALAALQEKKAEQADSDRLAILQQNALYEARRQGAQELLAERTAIDEAAASAAAYDAEVRIAADATAAFAASARQAQGAVEQAFSQIGVRSVAAIRAEIDATERSLLVLEAGFERGSITAQDMARGIGAAQARLQDLRAEAAKLPEAAGVLERMNESVLGLVNRFGALSAAVATVGFAVKPIIDANIELESMRRVLSQVFGSLGAANQQIAFLQQTADKSGVSIKEISNSFVQFAASAKASGVELSVVQEVFKNTVAAAGNLGLSGEKVSLILEALGQVASKGVVAMQELRQQLGNSLPGALQLMADGLGITQAQLVKLVESGQLLSSQALPAIAQAMTKLAAQGDKVEGLQQTFARLQNEVTKTYQKFSETSAYTILNRLLSGLANNFTLVYNAAKSLGELWVASKVLDYVSGVLRLNTALGATKVATEATTVSTVAATVAEVENTTAQVANTAAREANVAATTAQTVANGKNSAAWGELATSLGAVGPRAAQTAESAGLASRAFGAMGAATRGLLGLIGGLPGILLLVALNARELGTAIGESTARFVGWGKVLDENEKKLKAQSDAEKAAYDASQKLGDSVVKLMATYAGLVGPLQQSILASEKRLKATKDESEATTGIIALTGNQKLILDKTTESSLKSAAAGQAVADARNKESVATAALVVALQDHEKAAGKLSDGERKQLTTLQATLDVQKAATEEAQAMADKLSTAAAGAKLASDSYGDLSGRLDKLRQGYLDAKTALDVAHKGLDDGSVSQSNYNSLLREAAVAEGMFTKALADSQAAMQRKIGALESDLSVQSANTNAKIQASKASEAFYRSIGDEASAIREKVTQAELEEAQLRKTSAAKLQESKIMQQAAEQELADAKAKGTLTAALQAEIDKRIANAKAMAIEAGAEQSRIREIDSEVTALNNQADAIGRTTAATQQATAATKASAGSGGGDNTEPGGFRTTGSGGSDIGFGNTGFTDLLSKVKAGTISAADSAELATVIATLKSNKQTLFNAQSENPGLVDPEAFNSVNSALTQLLQAQQNLTNQAASRDTSAAKKGSSTSTSTDQSGASTSHTVNITLNGTATTINAASAADASALASIMSQLAAAAKTAQIGG